MGAFLSCLCPWCEKEPVVDMNRVPTVVVAAEDTPYNPDDHGPPQKKSPSISVTTHGAVPMQDLSLKPRPKGQTAAQPSGTVAQTPASPVSEEAEPGTASKTTQDKSGKGKEVDHERPGHSAVKLLSSLVRPNKEPIPEPRPEKIRKPRWQLAHTPADLQRSTYNYLQIDRKECRGLYFSVQAQIYIAAIKDPSPHPKYRNNLAKHVKRMVVRSKGLNASLMNPDDRLLEDLWNITQSPLPGGDLPRDEVEKGGFEYRTGCEMITSSFVPAASEQYIEQFHRRFNGICGVILTCYEVLLPPQYLTTRVHVRFQSGEEKFDTQVLRHILVIWTILEEDVILGKAFVDTHRQELKGVRVRDIEIKPEDMNEDIHEHLTEIAEQNEVPNFRDIEKRIWSEGCKERAKNLHDAAVRWYHVPDRQKLMKYLQPPRLISFTDKPTEYAPYPNTIQFNAMEGSLHAGNVTAWGLFCCQLLTTCGKDAHHWTRWINEMCAQVAERNVRREDLLEILSLESVNDVYSAKKNFEDHALFQPVTTQDKLDEAAAGLTKDLRKKSEDGGGSSRGDKARGGITEGGSTACPGGTVGEGTQEQGKIGGVSRGGGVGQSGTSGPSAS
ncbi:hypothetical protein MKZ38_004227 [Zalerion maritima]|uniref:Uncharacterized protein n=1 Tax=Zalerion maritima TaxID=339359 RepID=A0AAD5RMP2_9PEZI|nr:hypothetical protein MKZ38_004227 [Zalerion maritima]